MNLLVEKIDVQNMELKKVNEAYLLKLINNLNYKGLKISREKDIFTLFRILKKKKGISSLYFLDFIVKKVSPLIFLKRKKVGGATYRIPVYLYKQKAYKNAIKWIIQTSCGRKAGHITPRLVQEFSLIVKNQGNTLDKKSKLYQQALSNRAYIKYL